MLTERAAEVAAHAHTAAICLDFDGTLAPIVDDPNEARPLPGTEELIGAGKSLTGADWNSFPAS
jgi:trehalose-6-phosphatase